MTQNYCNLRVNDDIKPLLDDAEKLYRDNYKHFRGMKLSRSKILLEVLLFYLKGTKYEVKK